MGQLTVGSNPTPSAMTRPDGTRDASTTCAAMEVGPVEAEAALVHGDVPIGAVVVRAGVVIAQRHNERERQQDPTAHAEVLALQDAARGAGLVAARRLHARRDARAVRHVRRRAAVNARIGRLVYGAPT